MGDRKAAFSIELSLDEDDEVQKMIPRDSGMFVVTLQKIIRIRTQDQIDPTGSVPEVPIEQTIYLPHGSTDFIVARTIIQTTEIAEIFFQKDSEKYRDLLEPDRKRVE